ncbi:ABC transporter ATP-binding protein [uncultured Pseudacidovorax sp.]|uniref:ABC transporter ATP-binding protein n=1 Tax=uncultured Pseudacidovorax sp. TaxID=679313 RepID=UPI0025E91BFD|nr:ABC transporter ATP-binding protein [uncultured Pseudacidovorax sp.]
MRHAAPALPTRPLVRLRGVEKTYASGTRALQGLDLDIGQHEFLSLLGPSGCGKSTALRIVAGLGEATGGTIDWPTARHDARGRPLREIGFVFQEPNLMPWATVFDNVWLPLRLANLSRAAARSRVESVLDMVGLLAFANAYPRELSGGMKMRVSIARALVTQPRLLLMDEPFAALDEITRFKLNNDLLAIWQQARCTVVFVTHSVYESVYLSSRILVFAARPGRVVGEVSIDAPYPRDNRFRLTPGYTAQCAAVSDLLDRAMRSPAACVAEEALR